MSGRLQALVLVVCCILLLALAMPNIEMGRQAARQMQSKNNLKQLGLAFHNYLATHKRFPLGADFDDLGPKHGWFTRLMPYIEASSLYNRINMDVAWEHPFNSYLFQRQYGCVLNPQIDWRATAEGYGLLHYFGNPSIVHRNSQVKQDDLTSGLSNSWLVSEIGEGFQPWGYPFNWRSLSQTVASQSREPTLWKEAIQICRADGSVTLLSFRTDARVIERLDRAPPVATAEQTIIPPRVFELEKQLAVSFRSPIKNQGKQATMYKERWGYELMLDSHGVACTLEFSTNEQDPLPEFSQCVAENRNLRVVILRYPLTDDFALELAKLHSLQALSVAGAELTDEGITHLAKMTSLRILAGVDQDSLSAVQSALPDCQISSGTTP